MGLATLGGVPMYVDPDSVRWTFDMKIAEKNTLGGKVIQVFGTELGDMIISGKFGRPDTTKRENAGWEAQERLIAQVRTWVVADANTLHPVPLRFLYPTKKWDFKVFIKAFSSDRGPFEHANDNINPGWTMTMFVYEDSTGAVVKGIKDMYLSRLMNGVGWKQTDYNGPSAEVLAATLNGKTVRQYLSEPFVSGTVVTGPGQAGAKP